MAEPIIVPLTQFQQRDVVGLLAEQKTLQSKLDVIARTVVAGASIDPDTLGGYQVSIDRPEIGLVLTPPQDRPVLMEA